jgi:ribosomal protein S27AE
MIPGVCGRCGYDEQGSAGRFIVKERPMTDLGEAYTTGEQTLVRELLCPSCGAQVDAHVARRGDVALVDMLEEK